MENGGDREQEKRTVYTGRVQSNSVRYWANPNSVYFGLGHNEPARLKLSWNEPDLGFRLRLKS